MLILLSPAKTLDESKPVYKKYTQPQLLDSAKQLVEKFKSYSAPELQKKMHVSKAIAELTKAPFEKFTVPHTLENAKQALFSFKGAVYRDIDINNYTPEDLAFAQQHLRILSGLYGVLRPLDLMQPYRLEMKIVTPYWIEKVHEMINKESDEVIINLASQEYVAVLGKLNELEKKIITTIFKERKNGEYKIVTIYTKFARGTMANWIITNNITSPKKLKDFSEDGYNYEEKLSGETTIVFTRG